jgi:DNA helicase-2/ATP-dependent DNA helicase PcrA
MSIKIYSLGHKKEDKKQKIELFEAMKIACEEKLRRFPTHVRLQETLAPTMLRGLSTSLDAITDEYDAKPITAWKNEWLDVMKDGWKLKEYAKMEDSRALAEIYCGYRDALKSRSLIDFSDMILRAIRLIESDDTVRATIAEQYQWVMIDEYQDTNDAQLRLITGIMNESREKPNIFAVGDDDQSIYKFQGANTRNIRIFHDLYADTQLIILDTNYRSKQELIDFSRAIMDESETDISVIFPGETKHFESAR